MGAEASSWLSNTAALSSLLGVIIALDVAVSSEIDRVDPVSSEAEVDWVDPEPVDDDFSAAEGCSFRIGELEKSGLSMRESSVMLAESGKSLGSDLSTTMAFALEKEVLVQVSVYNDDSDGLTVAFRTILIHPWLYEGLLETIICLKRRESERARVFDAWTMRRL